MLFHWTFPPNIFDGKTSVRFLTFYTADTKRLTSSILSCNKSLSTAEILAAMSANWTSSPLAALFASILVMFCTSRISPMTWRIHRGGQGGAGSEQVVDETGLEAKRPIHSYDTKLVNQSEIPAMFAWKKFRAHGKIFLNAIFLIIRENKIHTGAAFCHDLVALLIVSNQQ